jgi:thymidylate synthase (FAD)
MVSSFTEEERQRSNERSKVNNQKKKHNMIEVTYVNHMGNDLTVVNSARVSFGKESRWHDHDSETDKYILNDKDYKLVHYLADHGHYSPFGHCFASFHVKAPIFVARQLVKHKFLRWNEISRRYVDSEPEFYKPELREAVSDKKQGSGVSMFMEGYDSTLDGVIRQSGIEAAKQYTYLLKMGVCEEQARMVLPQNTMTEWYWSGSLDAFADMCNLRCTGDTQLETRLVANQICNSMNEWFAVSWLALRLNK